MLRIKKEQKIKEQKKKKDKLIYLDKGNAILDLTHLKHRIKKDNESLNYIFNCIAFKPNDDWKKGYKYECDFNVIKRTNKKKDEIKFKNWLDKKTYVKIFRKIIPIQNFFDNDKILKLFNKLPEIVLNEFVIQYSKVQYAIDSGEKIWENNDFYMTPLYFAEYIYKYSKTALDNIERKHNNRKFFITSIIAGTTAVASFISSIVLMFKK